jgi:hypothetical protein
MTELRRLVSLGPISVVLRDQPDLGSAPDLLIRYERAYNEALHLRLHVLDGVAPLVEWLSCRPVRGRDRSPVRRRSPSPAPSPETHGTVRRG